MQAGIIRRWLSEQCHFLPHRLILIVVTLAIQLLSSVLHSVELLLLLLEHSVSKSHSFRSIQIIEHAIDVLLYRIIACCQYDSAILQRVELTDSCAIPWLWSTYFTSSQVLVADDIRRIISATRSETLSMLLNLFRHWKIWELLKSIHIGLLLVSDRVKLVTFLPLLHHVHWLLLRFILIFTWCSQLIFLALAWISTRRLADRRLVDWVGSLTWEEECVSIRLQHVVLSFNHVLVLDRSAHLWHSELARGDGSRRKLIASRGGCLLRLRGQVGAVGNDSLVVRRRVFVSSLVVIARLLQGWLITGHLLAASLRHIVSLLSRVTPSLIHRLHTNSTLLIWNQALLVQRVIGVNLLLLSSLLIRLI